MEIVQKAPAKINLSLDALFQHQDGNHEWKMVMTSVDLADYVTIKPTSKSQIQVTTNSGFLPEDDRNLAYKAARILQKQFQIQSGADIHIDKKIPVAAGLGGGSSDAAAVLRGLNEIWELGLDRVQLAQIGLSVDSDVPFCVYSETALVEGKGEVVTPLGDLPSFWVVLAKPEISVSTQGILRSIDYTLDLPHPDIDRMVAGIKTKNYDEMISVMGNTLEGVSAKRFPEISWLKSRLLKYGADAVQMSGSGPTVFGVCRNSTRAQRIYNSMKGFCDEVYLVRPVKLTHKNK